MTGLKAGLLAGLGALALAGCSTISSSIGGGGSGDNYASGSALEYRLSGGDRDALGHAFLRAMETGTAQNWRGRRAAGVVNPGTYSLANLQENPRARIPAARADFDISHRVETELGLYVTTRNANVRIGPGTNYEVAEMLTPGAGAEVVGRVVDKSWMLIAVDGVVRGYVFQDLLIKAPGTELELAGGPQRRPLLCREFTQRVDIEGVNDAWTGRPVTTAPVGASLRRRSIRKPLRRCCWNIDLTSA